MVRFVCGAGYRHLFLAIALFGLLSLAATGQVQTIGQWSTMSQTMPINPIHVALLANGKILVVAGSGNCPPSLAGCPLGAPYGPSNNSGALLFDPSAGSFTQFSLSWDMFCNGMSLLPDGRAFINGGTIQYDPFEGQPKSAIFDPASNTFTNAANMAHGRWYPTLTTLGDGRVMTFSGANETSGTNTAVEIYQVGSGWSTQYIAPFTPDLYPRMHLLPNGKVFASGAPASAYIFDPSTTSFTQNVATTKYGSSRSYGSSVLLALTPANGYDPKIMLLGGNSPATATTEIIDMGASSPKWAYGPSMSQARIEMNAVILPNGKVLAMGGSVNDESSSSKSLNADLYDPSSNTFSSAGANVYARLYHSVALLLPDATVWLAGGNPSRGSYESHMEIYKPAYLFNSSGSLATRPSITSAPTAISYGNTFSVQTPDAANIASAALVRNGTVTHSFGMDQRMVGLSFSINSGSLTVTAPPTGNIAPPGYYMLFLLNSSGVPSVAKFVQVTTSVSNPAPTVTGTSPSSGTANGGTAVTITGTGFLSGASVKLGGTSATNVAVTNSSTITATTPAHSAGAVSVVVTNSDGQGGTLNNGYTYTGSTSGAVNFVQQNYKTTVSGSTLAVTYPAAQTAGNLNVVAVGWNDTSSSVSSITDSGGNTYVRAVGPTAGSALTQSIYYAKNIAGGSNTVTVVFNQTAAYPDVRVVEYSGADTANPLDVTVGASGSGTTANSGSATTSSANDLVFGAGMTFDIYNTAGSGFSNRVITNFGDIAEDKYVTSTGSYNATAGVRSSAAWVMQMATFRASGQGGGGNPAPTVTGIGPSSGTANGGTAVTITGTGFLSGASVKLGGTSATNVSVTSSSTITATTPAHTAGAVSVVVTNSDGQSGTLSNGYTYTSSTSATVTFVQQNYKTSNPSGSTLVATYPTAQTAGNLNVVAVGWNDTTSSVSSITDSAGNTYVRAVGPTPGTALTQSIYYAKNIVGGSNTVTVVFNKTAAYPDVRVLEYSGADKTSPLDVTAAAVGTGLTGNSGSAATTSANELIFGAGMTFDIYNAAGSGFTNRVITNFGDIAEDKSVTSTGSYNATAAMRSSAAWVMQMATFKAAQ